MSQSTIITAAEEVARIAGNRALGYFGDRTEFELKADGSPVSLADRDAEVIAREWIMDRFPDDGITGEELGVVNPFAERQWIVDPIDATRSFRRGVPLWGTLVAVKEGTDVIAGAAFFPALGEMIVAAPCHGCWWNGVRASVSEVSNLKDAAILTTDERFFHDGTSSAWRDLAFRAELSRTWGDCYGYLLVATGRAEAMIDVGLAPWDSLAFQPIITEAGGRITDWQGGENAGSAAVIATNAALAGEIRARLAGTPPERRKNA